MDKVFCNSCGASLLATMASGAAREVCPICRQSLLRKTSAKVTSKQAPAQVIPEPAAIIPQPTVSSVYQPQEPIVRNEVEAAQAAALRQLAEARRAKRAPEGGLADEVAQPEPVELSDFRSELEEAERNRRLGQVMKKSSRKSKYRKNVFPWVSIAGGYLYCAFLLMRMLALPSSPNAGAAGFRIGGFVGALAGVIGYTIYHLVKKR